MKYFQSAIIKYYKMLDGITLIMALNFLNKNFEMTLAFFLYFKNKDCLEIKEIVSSIKVANMIKYVNCQMMNLAVKIKRKLDTH